MFAVSPLSLTHMLILSSPCLLSSQSAVGSFQQATPALYYYQQPIAAFYTGRKRKRNTRADKKKMLPPHREPGSPNAHKVSCLELIPREGEINSRFHSYWFRLRNQRPRNNEDPDFIFSQILQLLCDAQSKKIVRIAYWLRKWILRCLFCMHL